MAFMGMDAFPELWAWYMTEHWAMDSVDGFYSSVPLTVRAMKDWDSIIGLDNDFVVTPDTNWWAIRGMYKHHVCKHANACTLGHLKNYHMHWGIPIAPESFDRDPADDTLAPWGDQYSNFNAGKISLILEGILGLSYSVVDDHFTVSDHLPVDWDYMETIVPINENGNTGWTKVRVSRSQNGSSVVKTIEVEGNTRSELNIQPWLEEKDLVSAPAGYIDYEPRGHIGYQFGNTKSKTVTINLEENSDIVRIMPLGDSITAGGNSYRKRLYELLTGDGYVLDMVGSQNNGAFADTDHEGHSGWHADSPAGDDDIVGQINNWLTLNPADIVLLHIGTNDVSGGGENPAEVAAILDIIKAKDPSTTVIVARIILRNDTKNPETIAYNDGIEAIVNARIIAGDNLRLVNMEDALSLPEDLKDQVHPTVAGYEKMADVWYPAVKSIIGLYD
jgi:lysophospholipase L1-like esterase